MAAQPAAAQSLVKMLGGSERDRCGAYAELETTEDSALATACTPALLAVLAKPAAEVGYLEWRRGALALARLAGLDPCQVGREYFQDMRFLSMYKSGNALDEAAATPLHAMTKESVRTVALGQSALAAIWIRGYDPPLEAAGINFFEVMEAVMREDNAQNRTMQQDKPKLMRFVTLLLELVRTDRDELSAGEVAGVWRTLGDIARSPAVCLHIVQEGAMQLVIDELHTGSPAEWVSASSDPSGRFGSALYFIDFTAGFLAGENMHLIASAPRLLDVYLSGLQAYKSADKRDPVSVTAVVGIVAGLYELVDALFHNEANKAAIRGSASSIRFVLDNPLVLGKDIGFTTNMAAAFLASAVFGRDEEDSLMELCQADVDESVTALCIIMNARFPMPWPVTVAHSKVILNISVSDRHKLLLLESPGVFELLTLGMFTNAENHPMGTHAAPPQSPTPIEMQAICQKHYTEAVYQLALFPAGRKAIQQHAALISSLDEVAAHGLTPEAKDHATGALAAIVEKEMSGGGGRGGHIMLSYQWDSQTMIKRIHSSLLRRGYLVWIDTEHMRGSTMDAMSEAIEGSAVICYGVSLAYKESCNCRLELNYAQQNEGVDMIPLMMEPNYKPKGWLGLIMGTRLYYKFHGDDLSDNLGFETRMDSLTREIGDRAKVHQAPLQGSTQAAGQGATQVSDLVLTAHTPVAAATGNAGLQSTVTADSLALIEKLLGELLQREQIEKKDAEAEKMQMQTDIARLQREIKSQKEDLITADQIAALQQRLQIMHGKQLVNDDELHHVEDVIADFVELKLLTGNRMITEKMVYHCFPGRSNVQFTIVANLHKLVHLSETLIEDGALARQMRRKVLH